METANVLMQSTLKMVFVRVTPTCVTVAMGTSQHFHLKNTEHQNINLPMAQSASTAGLKAILPALLQQRKISLGLITTS
jgi:hypothetical protein